MRKILSLLAILSILVPANIAMADHESRDRRESSRQDSNDRNERRSSSSSQFDSSDQAELDQRSYVDPSYSDYPVWAGLAFSPRR